MKRNILLISISMVFVFFTAQVYAETDFSVLDGFNVRAGVNHLAGYSLTMFGTRDMDGALGSHRELWREPDQKAGFSAGAEYLLRIPSHTMFEFGLGVERNFTQELKSWYQNPMRWIVSVYDYTNKFSSTAVYVASKYHFPTSSSVQTYLSARAGYAFCEVDDFTYGRVLYGETPEAEVHLDMKGDIEDVKHSPYIGIGFGVVFKDHFFIESMYTYTRLRYRMEMAVDQYASYNPMFNYTAEEKHDIDIHTLYLNVGYKFGSHRVSESQQEVVKEERSLLSGLRLQIGFNKSFPMNSSEYKHHNYDLGYPIIPYSQPGDYALVETNWVDNPEKALTFAVGAEYMYPLTSTIKVGGGVEYHAENTYSNERAAAESMIPSDTFKQNFSNTVLYVAGKYHFDTLPPVKPYVLGRLGYSFNEWSFERKSGLYPGTDVKIDVAEDVENSLYYGIGFGIQLTRHVSTEIVYSATTIKTKTDYHGSLGPFGTSLMRDEKESKVQSLHIMLGVNL